MLGELTALLITTNTQLFSVRASVAVLVDEARPYRTLSLTMYLCVKEACMSVDETHRSSDQDKSF